MLAPYPLEAFVLRYRGNICITADNVSPRLKREEALGSFNKKISDRDGVLNRHSGVRKRHSAAGLQTLSRKASMASGSAPVASRVSAKFSSNPNNKRLMTEG